eukprot:4799414-Alexandrium_andersonii.AAC.1
MLRAFARACRSSRRNSGQVGAAATPLWPACPVARGSLGAPSEMPPRGHRAAGESDPTERLGGRRS